MFGIHTEHDTEFAFSFKNSEVCSNNLRIFQYLACRKNIIGIGFFNISPVIRIS